MLEELIEELRSHDRAEIAYKAGVSVSTVDKILSGANKDPKLSTVIALRKFLDEKAQEVGK